MILYPPKFQKTDTMTKFYYESESQGSPYQFPDDIDLYFIY